MPLPPDLTSDPSPMIGRDEFGNMTVVTKDGLAATFKDGIWQPGLLFSIPARPDSRDHFTLITDPKEREDILKAAIGALREWKRRFPKHF